MILPKYDDDAKCWIRSHVYVRNLLNYILYTFFKRTDIFNNVKKLIRINEVLKTAVKDYIRDPVKLSVVRKDMEFILMTMLRCDVQKFQTTVCQSDAQGVSTNPDKRKRKSCE